MQIETYSGKHDDEIIALILDIQNNEAKINLSLREQPDLMDIAASYQQAGGEFWIAVEDGSVVGTIGLMMKARNCAILKKFFVKREFCSQKIGLALYKALRAMLKARAFVTSYWIRPRLRASRTGFMKPPVSAESTRRSCPCRMPIRTGTACYICWICNAVKIRA